MTSKINSLGSSQWHFWKISRKLSLLLNLISWELIKILMSKYMQWLCIIDHLWKTSSFQSESVFPVWANPVSFFFFSWDLFIQKAELQWWRIFDLMTYSPNGCSVLADGTWRFIQVFCVGTGTQPLGPPSAAFLGC